MSFSEERPKLGSLAQSARQKHLNQVRGLLIVIGVLSVAFNLFLYFNARNEINEAINKEMARRGGFAQVDPVKKEQAITLVSVIYLSFAAVGGLYILFGIIVHTFPVPVTVLALVLYVGTHAAIVVWAGPEVLGSGWIIKIAITAALIGGIRTAIVYQQERNAELAAQDDYEHE